MQDGAAEINLYEDFVRSRRWRQLKLIVLQEEQAPDGRGGPRAARDAVQWTTTPHSQDLPPPQQFTAAVNLELFTCKN